MIKIGIYGARGRMGQEICQAILSDGKAEIGALYERKGHPDCGKKFFELDLSDDLDSFVQKSDIIIDFTSPEATLALLEKNKNFKKPLVIGTTGLKDSEIEKIKQSAENYPVVFSPNYSIGINVLLNVLADVGRVLSKEKGYDLEIVELHHRFKKDSPSGTALKLAEIAAKASGRNLAKDKVCGREGLVGERSIDEVGLMAVRGGDIVGEHTVMFCALGERVEIAHKAHSRQTFAKGAVEAAKWLNGKGKGLFTMKEVLGL